MLIKRQRPEDTQSSIPQGQDTSRYGEIIADINGQIWCRNKSGYFTSLASTSNYSKDSGTVNKKSVEKDVPSNASFSDHSYEISSGSNNGYIKVDWSIAGPVSTGAQSNSYEVKVTGLQSAAFQTSATFLLASQSSNFIAASQASNFITSAQASSFVTKSDLQNTSGTININATALEGSSLKDILDYIDEKYTNSR